MYNKEQERASILGVVRELAQSEVKFTKQQNFERAISLAKDELAEFDMYFKKFVTDVSHLEVFRDSIKEPLTKDVSKLSQSIEYLITRNYTQAERESMPHEVQQQVKATQERRFTLLRKVAQRYLRKPQTD